MINIQQLKFKLNKNLKFLLKKIFNSIFFSENYYVIKKILQHKELIVNYKGYNILLQTLNTDYLLNLQFYKYGEFFGHCFRILKSEVC